MTISSWSSAKIALPITSVASSSRIESDLLQPALKNDERTWETLLVALRHPQESLGVSLGRLDEAISLGVLADAFEQDLDGVRELLLSRFPLIWRSVQSGKSPLACKCTENRIQPPRPSQDPAEKEDGPGQPSPCLSGIGLPTRDPTNGSKAPCPGWRGPA